MQINVTIITFVFNNFQATIETSYLFMKINNIIACLWKFNVVVSELYHQSPDDQSYIKSLIYSVKYTLYTSY